MVYKKTNYYIKGKVTVESFKDGKKIREISGENMVVNNGLALIRDLLFHKNVGPTHLEVGESDTATTATMTNLVSPFSGKDDARGLLTKSYEDEVEVDPLKRTARFLRYIEPESDLNGSTLKEAGLFNRYNGGTMIARFVLPEAIDKSLGIKERVGWEFTISRDDQVLPSLLVDHGLDLIRDAIRNNNQPDLKFFDNRKYLSHVKLGSSDDATISSMEGLVSELSDENASRRVTIHKKVDDDVTAPMVRVIRYLPAGQLLGTNLYETAIFSEFQRNDPQAGIGQFFLRETVSKMFSRAPITPAILNDEKTLIWDISIKRGV